MNRVHASLWSVCAFATVYLLVGALHLPALTYDPIVRTVRRRSCRVKAAMPRA